MNRNDLERTVKQIIEKHVDVSHASLEYQAKLARAVSAMTKQIQRILDGTLKNEYPSERRWFSVNALDYEREHVPFEEVSRDFWITRYEDSLIEQELLRFAEMVDAAAPARVNYCVDEDFMTGKGPESEVSITGLIAYQLWKYTRTENAAKAEFEGEALEFLQSLEAEINGEWNFSAAERVYQRIYQFHKSCDIRTRRNNILHEFAESEREVMRKFPDMGDPDAVVDETTDDEHVEYEARKETEELYEEFCRATNRPFIVLPDLFYDIQEYSLKHIMGYRLSTITENCLHYAERYRSEENAWFWQSVDKALELISRYDEDGETGRGIGRLSGMVISYYLFIEQLPLLTYKCSQLSDERAKEQAIVDFVTFQYHGYPEEVCLGYPVMYKDLCSFLGVTPFNLASFEETEKEVRKQQEKMLQDRIEAKKRNDRDRENTANSCFALVYPMFNGYTREFDTACFRMRPRLIGAERVSFLGEKERDTLYALLLKIIQESAPHADAEKAALALMQMYVNIVHLKDRREYTDVRQEFTYYDWDEAIEKFGPMEPSSEAAEAISLVKALLPSVPEWKIKEQILILEDNLKTICGFYPGWTFEAHNSLWNEIDDFQYSLDIPVEGRTDGTLSYMTMDKDKGQVWGCIAQTIYEHYCRRLGTLPLDFSYPVEKDPWE